MMAGTDDLQSARAFRALADHRTAIATTVADPGVFRSAESSRLAGLVPRQNSTGGKTRLGGITKTR